MKNKTHTYIQLKDDTGKKLRILKANLDLSNYDSLINLLVENYKLKEDKK